MGACSFSLNYDGKAGGPCRLNPAGDCTDGEAWANALTTDEVVQESCLGNACYSGAGGLLRRRSNCLAYSADRDWATSSSSEPVDTCCLAWDLTLQEQEQANEERLTQFQQEFAKCVEFFGAQVLAHDATNGLIAGRALPSAGMTTADSLVRMGQLLCRWAVAQTPTFGIHIGVNLGPCDFLEVPASKGSTSTVKIFFGPACAGARKLAECGLGLLDCVVHMSSPVKDQLSALRPARLTLSPNSASYSLDPATEVLSRNRDGDSAGGEPYEIGVPMLEDLPQAGTPAERVEKMPIDKFVEYLRSHKVPVTKFGYGSAKTLREFYDAVVRHEKSSLVVKDGTLERVVELVRISLRVRDGSNKQLELRIQSQEMARGRTRISRSRNKPLAMVLHGSEQGRWQEAVERCFEVKFGLSAKVQKACFAMDKDAYSFREEKAKSDSIPGVMTTYRTHSIIIQVKDKAKQELQKVGLPSACDFSTDSKDGKRNWTWAPTTEKKEEEELVELLQRGGVDISEYTWQAFAELCEEVYEKRQSSIEVQENTLVRTIRILRIQLHADIFNLDHILLIKSKQKKGQMDSTNTGRMISMRMSVGQTWEDAVGDALALRLGIRKTEQAELLDVDPDSHNVTTEIGYSRSFPGLKSIYIITEVAVRVLNSHDRHWQFMGLPGGSDFTIVRMEAIGKTDAKEVVATEWTWQLCTDAPHKAEQPVVAQLSLMDSERRVAPERTEDSQHRLARVQQPPTLNLRGSDELLLSKLMQEKRTDWLRAHRAAARILDADYTTQDFYEDVVQAFPELRLYCINRSHCSDADALQYAATTGARTSDDEYQRTIGALFTIFWLMRLHLDGKECFCYGLDQDWEPAIPTERKMADDSAGAAEDFKKRQSFMENTDWSSLTRLLVGAGLLEKPGGPHDESRTLAMLVLMVIHDIMKLDVLLPSVSMGMTEYGGYKSGETISDHDAALSYVLQNCPNVLPSFAGLSKQQQDSIKFTHCKLDYNMGWLVQAEAPPGALFKAFRNVVISGRATASDIAFYFVHWFADLAGAEPCPMQGSEKFVLKFPSKVLGNFIDSFSVVWHLGPNRTETQVLEDYLAWRWKTHEPNLGALPTGSGSIARMRLVLMAQGDSKEVLRQFKLLPDEDRHVLSDEMAMTGLEEQTFERDRPSDKYSRQGPAILIYYSPALMQTCGRKAPRHALIVLAEVFRRARELWPLASTDSNRTIIVRVDALKDLPIESLLQPQDDHCFVLQKKSNQDGAVKLLCSSALGKLDWNTHQMLSFADRSCRPKSIGAAYESIRKGVVR